LISAPTGCGKEIFAQSIHNESLRRSKPFVVINCAAMPESILESILFGYVKGAFTGAHTEGKAGLFEVAHGGTIFIDEISELPYSLQSRFLRVLQEREVMRIGSDHAISIDVRIIAATNRNLLEMVQKGVFRADLYFRLSILPLKLPPLDSRISDVPDLARFFVTQKSTELGITPKSITPEAMNHLMQLHYPGNVRQLSNMIERAIVTSNGKSITLNDIADAFEESILPVETSKVPFSPDSEKTLPIQKIAGYPKTSRQLTAQDIQDALAQNLNSNTAAAAELGISTATLWRKRKKFGLL
jgi:transcriptional regulator with PAS, ATPase and Fis domain